MDYSSGPFLIYFDVGCCFAQVSGRASCSRVDHVARVGTSGIILLLFFFFFFFCGKGVIGLERWVFEPGAHARCPPFFSLGALGLRNELFRRLGVQSLTR